MTETIEEIKIDERIKELDNEPPMLVFGDGNEWSIGEPDLILRSRDFSRPAVGPDWWGDIGLVPTGLTEDRYVSAIQVREINDIPADGDTGTVGGRYIVHHMTYNSGVLSEDGTEVVGDTVSWPIHEEGATQIFSPRRRGVCYPLIRPCI